MGSWIFNKHQKFSFIAWWSVLEYLNAQRHFDTTFTNPSIVPIADSVAISSCPFQKDFSFVVAEWYNFIECRQNTVGGTQILKRSFQHDWSNGLQNFLNVLTTTVVNSLSYRCSKTLQWETSFRLSIRCGKQNIICIASRATNRTHIQKLWHFICTINLKFAFVKEENSNNQKFN